MSFILKGACKYPERLLGEKSKSTVKKVYFG